MNSPIRNANYVLHVCDEKNEVLFFKDIIYLRSFVFAFLSTVQTIPTGVHVGQIINWIIDYQM